MNDKLKICNTKCDLYDPENEGDNVDCYRYDICKTAAINTVIYDIKDGSIKINHNLLFRVKELLATIHGENFTSMADIYVRNIFELKHLIDFYYSVFTGDNGIIVIDKDGNPINKMRASDNGTEELLEPQKILHDLVAQYKETNIMDHYPVKTNAVTNTAYDEAIKSLKDGNFSKVAEYKETNIMDHYPVKTNAVTNTAYRETLKLVKGEISSKAAEAETKKEAMIKNIEAFTDALQEIIDISEEVDDDGNHTRIVEPRYVIYCITIVRALYIKNIELPRILLVDDNINMEWENDFISVKLYICDDDACISATLKGLFDICDDALNMRLINMECGEISEDKVCKFISSLLNLSLEKEKK